MCDTRACYVASSRAPHPTSTGCSALSAVTSPVCRIGAMHYAFGGQVRQTCALGLSNCLASMQQQTRLHEIVFASLCTLCCGLPLAGRLCKTRSRRPSRHRRPCCTPCARPWRPHTCELGCCFVGVAMRNLTWRRAMPSSCTPVIVVLPPTCIAE